MGFMDKLKGMVNPPDDVDDIYDDDDFGYGDDNDDTGYDDRPQTPIAPARQPSTDLNSNALELKVVRPETFDSATQIADHLLSRRTVVLNLEATNKETARRLIDFLTGVAYSIDGNIKKVANSTFVITPHNVGVSGESLQETNRQPQQAQDMYN